MTIKSENGDQHKVTVRIGETDHQLSTQCIPVNTPGHHLAEKFRTNPQPGVGHLAASLQTKSRLDESDRKLAEISRTNNILQKELNLLEVEVGSYQGRIESLEKEGERSLLQWNLVLADREAIISSLRDEVQSLERRVHLSCPQCGSHRQQRQQDAANNLMDQEQQADSGNYMEEMEEEGSLLDRDSSLERSCSLESILGRRPGEDEDEDEEKEDEIASDKMEHSDAVFFNQEDLKSCSRCGGSMAEKLTAISSQIDALTQLLVGDMHSLVHPESQESSLDFVHPGEENSLGLVQQPNQTSKSNFFQNQDKSKRHVKPGETTTTTFSYRISDLLMLQGDEQDGGAPDQLYPHRTSSGSCSSSSGSLEDEDEEDGLFLAGSTSANSRAESVETVFSWHGNVVYENRFSPVRTTTARFEYRESSVQSEEEAELASQSEDEAMSDVSQYQNAGNERERRSSSFSDFSSSRRSSLASLLQSFKEPSFLAGSGVTRISLVRDPTNRIVEVTRQDNDSQPPSVLYRKNSVLTSPPRSPTVLPSEDGDLKDVEDKDIVQRQDSVFEDKDQVLSPTDGRSITEDKDLSSASVRISRLPTFQSISVQVSTDLTSAASQTEDMSTDKKEVTRTDKKEAVMDEVERFREVNRFQDNILRRTSSHQFIELNLVGRPHDPFRSRSISKTSIGSVDSSLVELSSLENRGFIIKDLQSQIQSLQEKSIKKDSLIRKMAEMVTDPPEFRTVVDTIRDSTTRPSDRRIDFDIDSLCSFIEKRKSSNGGGVPQHSTIIFQSASEKIR